MLKRSLIVGGVALMVLGIGVLFTLAGWALPAALCLLAAGLLNCLLAWYGLLAAKAFLRQERS